MILISSYVNLNFGLNICLTPSHESGHFVFISVLRTNYIFHPYQKAIMRFCGYDSRHIHKNRSYEIGYTSIPVTFAGSPTKNPTQACTCIDLSGPERSCTEIRNVLEFQGFQLHPSKIKSPRILFLRPKKWWRRWESNPRPRAFPEELLSCLAGYLVLAR